MPPEKDGERARQRRSAMRKRQKRDGASEEAVKSGGKIRKKEEGENGGNGENEKNEKMKKTKKIKRTKRTKRTKKTRRGRTIRGESAVKFRTATAV